jgi:predicted N-acetyltransferase YhbS
MTRGPAEIEGRGERPEDESAIDTVTAQAFGSLNEASIVRWMRRVLLALPLVRYQSNQ